MSIISSHVMFHMCPVHKNNVCISQVILTYPYSHLVEIHSQVTSKLLWRASVGHHASSKVQTGGMVANMGLYDDVAALAYVPCWSACPASTMHWLYSGSMLGQLRRQLSNIEPTLGQCIAFTGGVF